MTRVVAGLFFLWLSCIAHAQVTVSTFSTGGTGTNGHIYGNATGGTPITISGFQSPASGDTFLLVFWSIADTPTFIGTPTVTWAGTQTMTQIGTSEQFDTSSATILTFGLVNPTSGSQTLSIAWTGGAAGDFYSVAGVSFKGSVTSSVAAATYGYAGNFNATANTTSTVTTATTVSSGDIAASMATAAVNGTFTAVSGTEIDIDNSLKTDVWITAANYASGSGSALTLTGTVSSSHWGAAAVAIKAATASSCKSNRALLGVGC